MADPWNPWTDDLAALGERTASQLHSIAATRATVLSHQEPKMSLFKRRPVFATLVTVAVLALAAPVAWAVGSRIFISIDPDKSAPEIERDVQQQLQSAGVQATVHAEKSGDHVQVTFQASEPVGSALQVGVPGGSGVQLSLHVETPDLDAAQLAKLQSVMTSAPVVDALAAASADQAKSVKILVDALTAAGFTADVHADDTGAVTLHVTAGPATP